MRRQRGDRRAADDGAGRWRRAAATTTTAATRRPRRRAGTTPPTEAAGTTTPAPTTVPVRRRRAGRPRVRPNEEAAACAEGKTLEPGALTVATGEPAFPPYVIDDDPENGQGFESAVAYAVAGAMGIGPAAVTWVRTPFEAAIQPGPQGLRLQPPAVLDQPGARGGRQLQPAVLRRQPGHPRLRRLPRRDRRVDHRLPGPEDRRRRRHDEPRLRHRRAAADRATRSCSTTTRRPSRPSTPSRSTPSSPTCRRRCSSRAVEIEGSEVFGQFPAVEGTEGEPWGMLFAKDNPLVECVNLALASLKRRRRRSTRSPSSG